MSGQITPKGAKILLQKELKLLLKTKRRIFLLTVIPIIILIMGVVAGFAANNEDEKTPENIQISVLDESPSNITGSLKSYWNTINDTDLVEISGNYSDIIEEINFHVFVYIPTNFTNLILNENISSLEIIYNTNASVYAEIAFDVLVLTSIFEEQLIISNNPEVVFDLIELKFYSVQKDDGKSNGIDEELVAQLVILPVYLIFFLVISPMSLILISVTTEREQKTLEMLFLQPVRRKDIVIGKVYYGLALILITIVLDLLSAIVAIMLFMIISRNNLSELIDFLKESIKLDPLIVIGFIVALIVIAINVIALAVLLSLIAKDEREANMISGLLPMLIFGMIGFIFIIPVDDFNSISQAIFVSMPVVGVIIAIYLSGLAGSVIWLGYLSVIAQIVWGYLIISLITKISEAESIIELSYGKVFKELKRLIFRR